MSNQATRNTHTTNVRMLQQRDRRYKEENKNLELKKCNSRSFKNHWIDLIVE